MPQPIPYLAFDGNCAEAMRFYAQVLDGKLDMLTFGQSPMADQTPKDAMSRIMHAHLTLSGFGMLTDKFGCAWIVNGEMIDVSMQS